MEKEQRLLQTIQLAALALVVIGCFLVLRVFIPAFIFAGVVAIASWPLYKRLCGLLRGHRSPAALLMVLLVILVVIGPTALLGASLVDGVSVVFEGVRQVLARGPYDPPAWLGETPVVGARLEAYWWELAGGGEAAADLVMNLLEPARRLLVGLAGSIGRGVVQLIFAVFIGFFIFRDGEAHVQTLRRGLEKVTGALGDELLATVRDTVTGVVHGVFGAAVTQALVALVGFLIAGVPGALLLGAATLFLSLVPVGPPLLWGGACLWLLDQGAYGRAIFLALWGMVVISSVDNLVRPYLISRGSRMSLLLIVLGVFGGIVAFGFIGIFIGPPILAVGRNLIRLWTARAEPPVVAAGPPVAAGAPGSDHQ